MNLKNKKTILFIVLLVTSNLVTLSQDLLYNNYKMVPLSSNPALIGIDNELKLYLSYKNQNSRFAENFNTPNLSFVYPFINKTTDERWGGIGVSVRTDELSVPVFLSTSGIDLAFAYNFKISDNQMVSASLQSTWNIRKVRTDKFTTGSQYNPSSGYDASMSVNENLSSATKSYFDLATGAIWYYTDKYDLPKYMVGVSAFHLIQPDISFFNKAQNLDLRYNAIIGARVFTNSKLMIHPDLFYTYLSGNHYINLGTKISFALKPDEGKWIKKGSISFTPRYIVNNSIALGFEFRQPQYMFILTYDLNTARFAENPVYYNGAEVVIGFRKMLGRNKQPDHILFAEEMDLKVGNTKPVIIKTDDRYAEGYEKGYKEAKKEVVNNKNDEKIIYDDESWAEAIIQSKQQITFPSNSAKFSPEAEAFFDRIANDLLKNPEYTLEIIGHADSTGTSRVNMRVSKKRAMNVAKYIENKGVESKRLKIVAKGDTEPVADNNTKEGRDKNRRVEFVIYKVFRKKNQKVKGEE